MNTRTLKWLIPAAAAVALTVISLWPGGAGNGIVWADVIRHISEVRTVAYTVTMAERTADEEDNTFKVTAKLKCFLKDPGMYRIDKYKTSGAVNADQEPMSGVPDSVEIRVYTPTKLTEVYLNPRKKTGRREVYDYVKYWEHLPTAAAGTWKQLQKITSDETRNIGERTIKGIRTVGFEASTDEFHAWPTTEMAPGPKSPPGKLRIWAACDTGIPVLVEYEQQVTVVFGSRVSKRHRKYTIDKIEWDVPLSDDLFKVPDLKEWTVSDITSDTRTVQFSDTHLQDDVSIQVRAADGLILLTNNDIESVPRGTAYTRIRKGMRSRTVHIMFLLTKAGQKTLKAFITAHSIEDLHLRGPIPPDKRLTIDFNGELQYQVAMMIYEDRRFRFVNNAVSFTTFHLDAKGRTGSNVTTIGGQLAIDITSLGITLEEFEDKYLTFRE